MIPCAKDIDFSRSLRAALGEGSAARAAELGERQRKTAAALLGKLYADKPVDRREIVLLADEVGLGKTFVALGVAWSVLIERKNAGLATGPVLVVTPESHALFEKWRKEAEAFSKLVLPEGQAMEVSAAETPHELAAALRKRDNRLVIARMSAFTNRLWDLDTARMSVLHTLFREPDLDPGLDGRLHLLNDWTAATRTSLDLRGSVDAWEAARDSAYLGFSAQHVRSALARMDQVDPHVRKRLRASVERIRVGDDRRSGFWEDIRELIRAAIGQTVPHHLPLVIVDEIHNWKNRPQSYWRFLHFLGGRVDRLLGLSATPFQLGPEELIAVLEARRALALDNDRATALDAHVEELARGLTAASATGGSLRDDWAELRPDDGAEIGAAWPAIRAGGEPADTHAPRVRRVLRSLHAAHGAHRTLEKVLRPFLVRHRRVTSHRLWWVGRDAAPESTVPSGTGAALRWRPGVDIRGDAELVHYLMMRGVQEHKQGRGVTALGADLGGSYTFFEEHRLKPLRADTVASAEPYFSLVERAVSADSHVHPKIAITAERAFRRWLAGEKTLVFCFNVLTVTAVVKAISERIEAHQAATLRKHFGDAGTEQDRRIKNFQSRLYNHRQALFLLFQDYPLVGERGRLPAALTLQRGDIEQIAARLAASGPPPEHGRFSRRRVIAFAEQVLAERWSTEAAGKVHLTAVRHRWVGTQPVAPPFGPDWPTRRAQAVEGVNREHEPEPFADEEADPAALSARGEAEQAWRTVMDGRAGRAALAPYLGRGDESVSILFRFHREGMARLDGDLRTIACRMLRRLLRSPAFLARFMLNDAGGQLDVDAEGEDTDSSWTGEFLARYDNAPQGAESARSRFDAYLDALARSADLPRLRASYHAASGNREVVARADGRVDGRDRDKLFTGFNTPLFPEVIVATTVGQEGIDLHRECRHVIHHDLPWNPATLEQRTGRVDRIGSKTERLAGAEGGPHGLDIIIPYIAGTYDEYRFRVVHTRAQLFEVTMGGDYAVDGRTPQADLMEAHDVPEDDEGAEASDVAELPAEVVNDLRLRLEAEEPG